MSEEWGPDILGRGFEQLTLPLGADEEGEVVATLVRRLPDLVARLTGAFRDIDVLYVHGWSDYFFQTELAHFWTEHGARFFALDLRKYGRSLRPHQTRGYIRSLDEYDADIAAARQAMDAAPGRHLVLLGHSTGGLTLTLWAARHPGASSAVILNSPWLELQLGPAWRQAITPLVNVRARIDPLGMHPVVDLGFYTRAQRELGTLPDAPDGWRPPQGFATHPGWLAAVVEGHARIAAGVDLGCPSLVMVSDRTALPVTWVAEMLSSDSVLMVDDIARAASRISPSVTIARVAGAIHDVFLSAAAPRSAAYAAVERFARSIR